MSKKKLMETNEIIKCIAETVKQQQMNESGGHGWWHTLRVWEMAKYIAEQENGNQFIVQISALLHDIADWKYNEGNEFAGGEKARELLCGFSLSKATITEICSIVDNISFKGAETQVSELSHNGKIVQDADRLDAIGAIGIARTFAYGGLRGRPMYDPEIRPQQHKSFDEYKKSVTPTINHFYEKLLLLKDRMNTPTAKQIAEERHRWMELFLEQFYREWYFCENSNTYTPWK